MSWPGQRLAGADGELRVVPVVPVVLVDAHEERGAGPGAHRQHDRLLRPVAAPLERLVPSGEEEPEPARHTRLFGAGDAPERVHGILVPGIDPERLLVAGPRRRQVFLPVPDPREPEHRLDRLGIDDPRRLVRAGGLVEPLLPGQDVAERDPGLGGLRVARDGAAGRRLGVVEPVLSEEERDAPQHRFHVTGIGGEHAIVLGQRLLRASEPGQELCPADARVPVRGLGGQAPVEGGQRLLPDRRGAGRVTGQRARAAEADQRGGIGRRQLPRPREGA